MKIGFCMLLWTTHVGEEHRPLLQDIEETGYDGVEVPVFEGEVGDFERIGAMLDDIGLERTAISAIGDDALNPVSPDAEVRRAAVSHLKHVADCTAAVGADAVGGPLQQTLGFGQLKSRAAEWTPQPNRVPIRSRCGRPRSYRAPDRRRRAADADNHGRRRDPRPCR